MSSNVYLKSIFDADDAGIDVKSLVKDYDKNVDKLKEIFSVIPKRATESSAGYDLGVLNHTVIPAHESVHVVFGHIIVNKHSDVTAMIVPRSSLAKKKGLLMSGDICYSNSALGVSCITCNFINYTDNPVILEPGEKIAQVVFLKKPYWFMDRSQRTHYDPLDERLMSPQLKNNIESIALWKSDDRMGIKSIDQTDKFFYSFQAPSNTILMPGKVTCIMTGLRCKILSDQVFILKNAYANSCVELANKVGVIDADYYDNPDNGGEIGVLLINRGNVPIQVLAGDLIATGAIYWYEKCEEDENGGERKGGFGSTDR